MELFQNGLRRFAFSISVFQLFSVSAFFQRRQLIAPVKDEPREAARAPETRDKNPRLGDGAKKPADVIFVGPIGDANLVAGEEAERSSDAMDRGPVIESLEQVAAELVLDAAADRDDDVFRADLPDEREKGFVFNRAPVLGRNVDLRNSES